jgi:hypothetical protein
MAKIRDLVWRPLALVLATSCSVGSTPAPVSTDRLVVRIQSVSGDCPLGVQVNLPSSGDELVFLPARAEARLYRTSPLPLGRPVDFVLAKGLRGFDLDGVAPAMCGAGAQHWHFELSAIPDAGSEHMKGQFSAEVLLPPRCLERCRATAAVSLTSPQTPSVPMRNEPTPWDGWSDERQPRHIHVTKPPLHSQKKVASDWVLLGSVDGDWNVVSCFPPPNLVRDNCSERVQVRQSIRTFEGQIGVITAVRRKRLEVGWTEGYSMETAVISTAPPPPGRFSFAVVTSSGSLDWGLVEPVRGVLPQVDRLAIEKAIDWSDALQFSLPGLVLLDWVREPTAQTQWLVLRKGDTNGDWASASVWTTDAGRWLFETELPDTSLLTSLEFVVRLTDSSNEPTMILAGSCRNSFYPVVVAVGAYGPQVWSLGCGI